MRSDEERLPPLREDFELIPGGINPAGDNTYIIRDIRSNRYIRVGADTFKVLAFWQADLTTEDFLKLLRRNGVDISIAELKECVSKVIKAQLTDVPSEKITEQIKRKQENKIKSAFGALLHNYLFFKIPIFYPDRFIKETLIYSDFFFSQFFLMFTGCLAVICVFFLIPQIDRLHSSFSVAGNFEMALKFAVSVVIGKSIHELSHAFAAARKGCHVGSLGVGFIVGAPIFYADVTDTWRLINRKDRMIVAAAGVVSEVVLAVYATALWLFNVNSFISDICLYLASTTWITTLLFNANPLMRFDGYHLLSDFLDIKNLQQRGFSAVSHKFREIVFGFKPTENSQNLILLFYGICSSIYRVFVITGIALILYHFVIRTLGFFLFGVEIFVFLIKPLYGQFQYTYKHRGEVPAGRAELGGALLVGGIAMIFLVPFEITVTVPGIATREQVIGLFERYDSEVQNNINDQPMVVYSGDKIGSVISPFLEIDLASVNEELAILSYRHNRVNFTQLEKEFSFSLAARIEEIRAKRYQLLDQLNTINIIAPIGGYFLPRNGFRSGQILASKTFIGTVISGKVRIIAFIPEKYLHRIRIGMRATFSNSFDLQAMYGKVLGIERSSVEKIRFSQLASIYGGPIRAHGSIEKGIFSEEALYRAIIELDSIESIKSLQSGNVSISVKSISLANEIIDACRRLILREGHLD